MPKCCADRFILSNKFHAKVNLLLMMQDLIASLSKGSNASEKGKLIHRRKAN